MKRLATGFLATTLVCFSATRILAQAPPPPPNYGPPPTYAPQDLDQFVAPYALYPDPLLAQVLTASTFSYQIPDADGWARSHAYLTGDALARAIQEDSLPWDPSVIALLPTPGVLDVMAGNMGATQELGNAVLANRGAVMDAVQDERQKAYNYGYLRSNADVRVVTAGPNDIEIVPATPNVVYVPYYDPNVVYFRPAPGFIVGGAISFGPGIAVGAFLPWGWGGVSIGWRSHAIIINNHPWERTWTNRAYVHPYNIPARPHAGAPRVERHEMHEYTPRGPAREEHGGHERR